MGAASSPRRRRFRCTPRRGEPSFVLLGRDAHAFQAVEVWATLREQGINNGEYPESDKEQVAEAREKAAKMRDYHLAHRKPKSPSK